MSGRRVQKMLTTIKLMSRQRTPQGKSIKKESRMRQKRKNNLREKCTGKNVSNYIRLLFKTSQNIMIGCLF